VYPSGGGFRLCGGGGLRRVRVTSSLTHSAFVNTLTTLAGGCIVPNPQIIDQPSGIDGESDVFLKHCKYTVALSYVFFVIATIWVLGSIAVCVFQQEANWGIFLIACIPGAIGSWLGNRARGVKEDQLPRSHRFDDPFP